MLKKKTILIAIVIGIVIFFAMQGLLRLSPVVLAAEEYIEESAYVEITYGEYRVVGPVICLQTARGTSFCGLLAKDEESKIHYVNLHLRWNSSSNRWAAEYCYIQPAEG